MFNNLIESSSHTREFKRRGSFVLFTTGIYAVLFIAAGVASIYAYDARLEDQNLEYVTMLSPVDFPAPATPIHNAAPPKATTNHPTETVRANPIASVNVPQLVPHETSAKPNPSLPVPDHGSWRLGDHDADALVAGDPHGNPSGSGNGTPTPVVEITTPPPPLPPVMPPQPKVVRETRVLNSIALSLPKPPYPAIAKQAGAQGQVNVQVLIDETGKVVSAKALKGHPLLLGAAQQAAYSARFSPTKLNDVPVKVSGMITYNFVLQ
jgi:periplasmic protein TonB